MVSKFQVPTPTDPNVHVLAFADTPRVALEVAAEEQLRGRARHLCATAADRELGFLRDDRTIVLRLTLVPFVIFVSFVFAEVTGNRAEMSPGSDDDGRLDRLVDDPAISIAAKRPDEGVLEMTHPG